MVKALRNEHRVLFIITLGMILWVLASFQDSVVRSFHDNLYLIGVASSLVKRGCLDPSQQRVHGHAVSTSLHNTSLLCEESLVSIDKEYLLTQQLEGRASELLFDLYRRNVISQEGRMINSLPETVSVYPVDVELGDKVKLIGVDILEGSIGVLPVVAANIYWLHQGYVWVEPIVTNNLAPGRGFEYGGGLNDFGMLGYHKVYANSPTSAYTLVKCRDPERNYCLRIENSGRKSAGISSARRSVNSDAIYLQGGWLQTDDSARGFIGVNWDVPVPQRKGVSYQYTVSTWTDTAGRYFVGAFKVPDGASKVQTWLLNFGTEGIVWFDDVFLMEVFLPDEFATGYSINDGRLVERTWGEFNASH